MCEKIFAAAGIKNAEIKLFSDEELEYGITVLQNDHIIGKVGKVAEKVLKQFDIKEPVFFACINWDKIVAIEQSNIITYREITKFPSVQRDLALIADRSLHYAEIENTINSLHINELKKVKLFDIFESEKIGADKRSMAVNFSFSDENKTLADADTDNMMNKIISSLEKNLNVTVRK